MLSKDGMDNSEQSHPTTQQPPQLGGVAPFTPCNQPEKCDGNGNMAEPENLPVPEMTVDPALVQKLMAQKLEEEKHEYLWEKGRWVAKREALKYWRAVFEAGGRGEEPPSLWASGVPWLILKDNMPKPEKQHRWFVNARNRMDPEERKDLERNLAAKRRVAEEGATKASWPLIDNPIDREASKLLPPEELAKLSYSQKEELIRVARIKLAGKY